jgi:hypothetical protein
VLGFKMRLLNTETFKLREYWGTDIPKYAILSHTWETNEVLFQELEANKNTYGAGYRKILGCCKRASRDGYQWVWIDTCCIDKTSSAELSESINSMFNWYQAADICYAYLSDVEEVFVDGICSHPSFRESRWFTRGWTLQELLSPREVLFLGRNWNEIGTRSDLVDEITTATGIPHDAYTALEAFSVAQRMSWASKRETTRIEDMAYCLLGVFGVNMPLLYGEGIRAFIRLQEEIIKVSDDESIFVWTVDDEQEEQSLLLKLQDHIHRETSERGFHALPSEVTGSGRLLAPRPSCFINCASVQRDAFIWRRPYSMTHKGLQIMTVLTQTPGSERRFIPLNCTTDGNMPMAMSVDWVWGYWVRCGFCQMVGDAEGLFEVMGNKESLKEIYISAQWPCQPIINLAMLKPRLVVDGEGQKVMFDSEPIRYEK